MTPVEVFAVVASGLILIAVAQLRGDGEEARATDGYDWFAGAVLLLLTWFVAVALAMVI